jgi:predicted phosphodiesterase
LEEHKKFITFLDSKFDEPFDGQTVVMTHHSPGNILKRKGNVGSLTDHCYFANLEDTIGNRNIADLWVHGHTHQNWDYMINETRVVCNPYGYWGVATNKGFNRGIVLEV